MAATLRSTIQQELPKIIAADDSDARYDPIMRDLLRIQGRPTEPDFEAKHGAHNPSSKGAANARASGDNAPENPVAPAALSIENYSLLLLELLHLIQEPKLDDTTRMRYEESLREVMAHIPSATSGARAYPNEYLSRVLIDNYQHLLKVSTSYFNMSLASQITRYLVRLVYSLECWEIYHLLLAIPNFDYFLRLVGFDIKVTSLGHMVRPPVNFLNFNLRQGLQYPFPFPFYNFSYHSVDRDSTLHKMQHVRFQSYIDLRLNKEPARAVAKRRPERPPKRVRVAVKELEPENMSATPERPEPKSRLDKKPETDAKDDFQKHQKVFIFIHKTLDNIAQEASVHVKDDDDDDDDGYDTDEAMAMMEEENNNIEGDVFVPSIFQKVLNDYEKRGAAQAIHQCRLLNTGDNKPCMKVFYGKNELQRHQEFVHATRKRNYKCFFCQQAGNGNQSYPRHDSLARHIRRKHGITGKENKRAVMLAREDAEKDEKTGTAVKARVEEPADSAHAAFEKKRVGEATFSTFSAKPQQAPNVEAHKAVAAKDAKRKPSWDEGRPKEFSIAAHMKSAVASVGASSAPTPAAQPETRISYDGRAPDFSWLPPPKHYIQGPGYGAPHEAEMKRPEPSTFAGGYVPYAGFQPNFMPAYYKHPDSVYYGESMGMGMPMKGYPVQYPFVNTLYPSQYAGQDKPVHRAEYTAGEMPLHRQSMYAVQSGPVQSGPVQPAAPASKSEEPRPEPRPEQ